MIDITSPQPVPKRKFKDPFYSLQLTWNLQLINRELTVSGTLNVVIAFLSCMQHIQPSPNYTLSQAYFAIISLYQKWLQEVKKCRDLYYRSYFRLLRMRYKVNELMSEFGLWEPITRMPNVIVIGDSFRELIHAENDSMDLIFQLRRSDWLTLPVDGMITLTSRESRIIRDVMNKVLYTVKQLKLKTDTDDLSAALYLLSYARDQSLDIRTMKAIPEKSMVTVQSIYNEEWIIFKTEHEHFYVYDSRQPSLLYQDLYKRVLFR